MLHHSPSENTVFGRIFCVVHTKITRSRPEIAKKRGVSPSDFRDFSDFLHSDAAVAFDELLNAAAEGDGSSDVVAQRREGEFGGDLFLVPAEKMAAVGVMLDGAEGMVDLILAEVVFVRAVQTQRLAVHELHLPARAREDDEYLSEQLSVFLSEVRDGAEVRLQPVQQKPQLHISPTFPHEPPRRADFVQIALEIQLQQVAVMIRRPPRPCGHGAPKPQSLQLNTSPNPLHL